MSFLSDMKTPHIRCMSTVSVDWETPPETAAEGFVREQMVVKLNSAAKHLEAAMVLLVVTVANAREGN